MLIRIISVVVFFIFNFQSFAYQSAIPPYGPAKAANGEVLNKNIVDFSSPEGRKMLANATHINDFYELAPHFQPQQNPVYCGVATGLSSLTHFG
jgi:hypothetical protein